MAAKGFGEVTANGFKGYCGDDTNILKLMW